MISIENGKITLKNSVGAKLVIHQHEDGKYGLGTFYMNDVKLGGTVTTFSIGCMWGCQAITL